MKFNDLSSELDVILSKMEDEQRLTTDLAEKNKKIEELQDTIAESETLTEENQRLSGQLSVLQAKIEELEQTPLFQ